uniref:Retrotransposon gag domain-containing protein n=1 Tax=Oreochromis aureus TaxID=47969 RepID=A0A668UI84_OREAU
MALLSLQPLAVFLDCPGEPKIPFAASKKLFDNYLLAIGGNDFATERKRALLIHCLGTEGQRIYSALPLTTDDYKGSVKALETYFHPKVNVVAERYRFRQRAQSVGESTDHYVAALRELVTQCKFGAMENEMLRDQLVEETNNALIRERLLMEEDLTLDRALEIARRTEAAIADAKAIAVGETKPVATVQIQKMRKPKYKAAKKIKKNSSDVLPLWFS